MKIDQVAAILYTLRDFCQTPADVAKTLRRVREIGYQAVQVSGICPIPEEDLKKMLADAGLVCCATHEAPERLFNETEATIERLLKLDCRYTAYPYPGGVDFTDRDSLAALIKRLDDAGQKMAESGITLCYHNHGIEFVQLDGMTGLDRIYREVPAKVLAAEIDTYWVQYGGGNPVDWVRKLKNRLPLLHLKDYGFTAENKPIYREIGRGTLDFQSIIREAEAGGCEWFIVEQDECPGDPFDSIRQSFDYIEARLCS